MASTVMPPDDTDATDRAAAREEDATAASRARRGRLISRLGVPIFVVLVLGALYLWVGAQDLDTIETRTLTWDVIRRALIRHIELTVYSTVIVLFLAVPAGILATRQRFLRLAPAIIGLGNAGQAIPSLGMLAILYYIFRSSPVLPSTGIVPVVVALVGYSFLPILRNTMVGLQQVDRAVLEAGRGMGMSESLVLRRIELPLAVPVILAGVRTALVLNVGTATLAFLFAGGGLGEVIYTGVGLRRVSITLTAAIITAALALLVDYIAGLIEEKLTPRGL